MRVLRLQNEIYKATQKHNLTYIYKLQEYLLNSNEAKVLATHITISEALILNLKFTYSNFHINNINILSIIRSFFNNDKVFYNKNIQEIIEKIKQNLVYLALVPYKQAKLKNITYQQFFKKTTDVHLMLYRQSYYFHYVYMNNTKLVNIISKRIQVHKYINELIIQWLYSGNIIVSFNLFNCVIDSFKQVSNTLIKYTTSIDSINLTNVIGSILFIDVLWLVFYLLIDMDHIVDYLNNNLYYIINQDVEQIYFIDIENMKFDVILTSLLHKIKLGKYRQSSIKKYINYIACKIFYIYKYFNNQKYFIHFDFIQYCIKYINIFLYIWYRKILCKNTYLFTMIKQLNYSINLDTYLNNIYKCYVYW